MKTLTLIAVILLLSSALFAQNAKFKIIVNNSNEISSISSEQLKKIYKKQLTKWDDGSTIKPVDQIKTSQARIAFSKQVLKKSVSAMKAYWQRQIFSGKGVPPPEKKSDQEVVDYVASHPGAIGYVSTATNTKTVKVITIK